MEDGASQGLKQDGGWGSKGVKLDRDNVQKRKKRKENCQNEIKMTK